LIIPDPAIEMTLEDLKKFINIYFEVKSIKLSERKDGSYFIRISDESAVLSKKLILKIRQMMIDLREKVR
jgi:uncharacterized ubiquitin-like protein YukD